GCALVRALGDGCRRRGREPAMRARRGGDRGGSSRWLARDLGQAGPRGRRRLTWPGVASSCPKLPRGQGTIRGHRRRRAGSANRNTASRPQATKGAERAMNTHRLGQLYDQLTPRERLPLIMAAHLRGDAADQKRLSASAPLKTLRVPNYYPLAKAL